MTDRKSQVPIQTIFPQPGDLIFVGTNELIDAAQILLDMQYHEFTHVAVMIGSDKLIEAMKRKEVCVHDFSTWIKSKERRSDKIRSVWRNPDFDLSKGLMDLFDNIAYRLGQGYDLGPLRRLSEFRDSDTVCSVLALNLIVESGILKTDLWGPNSPIYPAQLLTLIENNGFQEINFEEYAKAARTGIGGLDPTSHINAISSLHELDTHFASFLSKVRGFSDLVKRLNRAYPVNADTHYM